MGSLFGTGYVNKTTSTNFLYKETLPNPPEHNIKDPFKLIILFDLIY